MKKYIRLHGIVITFYVFIATLQIQLVFRRILKTLLLIYLSYY